MKRKILALLCVAGMLMALAACTQGDDTPKIGVSLGVGAAMRWANEKTYMEERAAEKGAKIEVRLNTTDKPKTQVDDCRELIDSGIDVLIITPRDASKVSEILDYAKSKKVPVISYARAVLNDEVDLFVGYDSVRIGQTMGQYLAELVYTGDYIILQGDEGDNNAKLLDQGARRYLDELQGNIRVILDAAVPGWSPEEAKRMVKEAVTANGNNVDAIFAPNDKLAGAAADALAELGVTKPVVITGMDAELAALQRIVKGTQSMTIYMNLRDLANTAIDQACNLAQGKKPESNAEFDNQSGKLIPSNLITGQVITKPNLDNTLIDTGLFSREEVYGTP